MKRDFYTSPKPNFITRILWKAAGADDYILKRSTYSDHVKYSTLGGIVCATGFMAALAEIQKLGGQDKKGLVEVQGRKL